MWKSKSGISIIKVQRTEISISKIQIWKSKNGNFKNQRMEFSKNHNSENDEIQRIEFST